jgi:hypothetical protein
LQDYPDPRKSALGRYHLTAELTRGMRFRVNIDIQFTGRELLCLFRGQRGLPADGARGRAALLAQPDHYWAILALCGRSVDMRHGHRTRKPVIGNRPGDDPGARVIAELGRSRAWGLDTGGTCCAPVSATLKDKGAACANPVLPDKP